MRDIDFLRPRRPPLVGWFILCIGLTLLAGAIRINLHWSDERKSHEAAVRIADESVKQARLAALKPVPPTVEQMRLNRIAPLLRQPWLPVLRLVEASTKAPVYLVAMSIDPTRGAIKLEGEAPSLSDALVYVQHLNSPGEIQSTQLRSHEQFNDQAGKPLTRFTVEARWNAR